MPKTSKVPKTLCAPTQKLIFKDKKRILILSIPITNICTHDVDDHDVRIIEQYTVKDRKSRLKNITKKKSLYHFLVKEIS